MLWVTEWLCFPHSI